MTQLPDFSRLANQLIAATRRDVARGVQMLEPEAPSIAAQIRQDASRRGPLPFWGRSLNVDDVAKVTIVDPHMLIASLSGRTLSAITPHAGLQHTYGYLLSTIETPYGLKRDRWMETHIETAFGLNPSTLGPQPDNGTLLANASWLAGMIAFRGNLSRTRHLQDIMARKVSAELPAIDFHNCKHERLSERITVKHRGNTTAWTLQTDLVSGPAKSNFLLLVYSVVNRDRNRHQLITLFPTSTPAREAILSQSQQ